MRQSRVTAKGKLFAAVCVLALGSVVAAAQAQTGTAPDGAVDRLERRIRAGLQERLYRHGGIKLNVEVGHCSIWIRERIRQVCDAGPQAVMADTSIALSEIREVQLGEHVFEPHRRIVRFRFKSETKTIREAADALLKSAGAARAADALVGPAPVPKIYRFSPGSRLKKDALDEAGIRSHYEVFMCSGLKYSQQDVSDLHIQLTGKDVSQLVADMGLYLRHCNSLQRSGAEEKLPSAWGAVKQLFEGLAAELTPQDERSERVRKLKNIDAALDMGDDELDRRLKDIRYRPRTGFNKNFDGVISDDDTAVAPVQAD